MPAILTKITLDMGFVILIVSSLSFLGLGVQPPTPDLGSMVAEGAGYMPDSGGLRCSRALRSWWQSSVSICWAIARTLGVDQ